MFDTLRKTISFLVGLLIVIAAVMNECPRLLAISIGLLLMGLFTVPETFWFLKGQYGDDSSNKPPGGDG